MIRQHFYPKHHIRKRNDHQPSARPDTENHPPSDPAATNFDNHTHNSNRCVLI